MPEIAMQLALIAIAALSVLFLLGRSYSLLIWTIVAAGWSQSSLLSITHSLDAQYVDDIPTIALIVGAIFYAVQSGDRRNFKALGLVLVLVAVVGFGFIRSPDAGIGLAQARQVLLPLGLMFAGFALRDAIRWRSVQKTIIFFGFLTILWIGCEEVLQRPLLDPVWYYIEGINAKSLSLREGLPPAYFADGIGGETIFRPGGPYMNAPVMGFILGLSAYAAVARLRGVTRIVYLAATVAALYVSYARAGLLIFAVVTIIYFIWLKVGRLAGVFVAAGLGVFMIVTFLDQGNTASHSEGLQTGFLTGLTSPLGLGFGTTGYQAALEIGSMGVGAESLLGLYFAWLGWPMIAAAAVFGIAMFRRLRGLARHRSLEVWAAVAFMLAVASSESASSIASTPMFWVLCGTVLGTSFESGTGRLALRREPRISLSPGVGV
ncbi:MULTISPECIES: hypothetical protein [unclassified Pseudarthrobacter]|uniref:hypothetical protein n=1 Tax=unclassified Pseudarthrobacter TaxID=2647000 RepID=UPI00363071D9